MPNGKLKDVYEHISNTNKELGKVQVCQEGLLKDVSWLKTEIKSLNNKVWGIVAGIIFTIILQIYLKMI